MFKEMKEGFNGFEPQVERVDHERRAVERRESQRIDLHQRRLKLEHGDGRQRSYSKGCTIQIWILFKTIMLQIWPMIQARNSRRLLGGG